MAAERGAVPFALVAVVVVAIAVAAVGLQLVEAVVSRGGGLRADRFLYAVAYGIVTIGKGGRDAVLFLRRNRRRSRLAFAAGNGRNGALAAGRQDVDLPQLPDDIVTKSFTDAFTAEALPLANLAFGIVLVAVAGEQRIARIQVIKGFQAQVAERVEIRVLRLRLVRIAQLRKARGVVVVTILERTEFGHILHESV